MDVNGIFKQFVTEIFPDETIEVNTASAVAEFELFYPHVSLIIQKDSSFFNEDRTVFGRNLSKIDETKHDLIFKNLVPCMIASFFHGDIKQKVGKISDMIKNIWNASGQQNDTVTKILNDEASEGRFKDILDFVLQSRLVKIFTSIMESFDISEFELNVEDPAELIEMMKNPENPAIKKIITKIQNTIKDKIRRGEFDQNTITREVEAIKAKVMSLFGNVFNDALGGRRQGNTPAAVIMGNSPEARRQRILARLQRKLQEKNSK
jgi:hypothetical protein